MSQYLGMTDCPYYKGKVGEVDHRCCGGRITKYAAVKCEKKGKIVANDDCKKICSFYPKNITARKIISPFSTGDSMNTDNELEKGNVQNAPSNGNDFAVNSIGRGEMQTHVSVPGIGVERPAISPKVILPPKVESSKETHRSVWKQWEANLAAQKAKMEEQKAD